MNKSRAVAICCLTLCMITAARSAATADGHQEQAVEPTLDLMLAYLSEYRTNLTVVIAEEHASQRVNRQVPPESNAPRRRTTTGEVHFRFIEDGSSWMAIREVQTIDKEPVSQRSDLAAALRELDAGVVARSFKTFNSQYNIGRVVRTFNEPTLSLDILEPRRIGQFTFKREGSKTENGVTLVTLSFKEKPNDSPFILDLRMRQADVRGEFVVEAETGRIRKTTLNVKMNNVRAALVTTYAYDENVDLWVPVEFTESYIDGFENTGNVVGNISLQYESISCESTYSNFRRFSATSRIK